MTHSPTSRSGRPFGAAGPLVSLLVGLLTVVGLGCAAVGVLPSSAADLAVSAVGPPADRTRVGSSHSNSAARRSRPPRPLRGSRPRRSRSRHRRPLPEIPVVDAAPRSQRSAKAVQPGPAAHRQGRPRRRDPSDRSRGGRQHAAARDHPAGGLVPVRFHPERPGRHHGDRRSRRHPVRRPRTVRPAHLRPPRRTDRHHRPGRRRARVPVSAPADTWLGPGCRSTSSSTATARHGLSSSPAVARTMPATATTTTSWSSPSRTDDRVPGRGHRRGHPSGRSRRPRSAIRRR